MLQEFVVLDARQGTGSNAVDFHIAHCIGSLADSIREGSQPKLRPLNKTCASINRRPRLLGAAPRDPQTEDAQRQQRDRTRFGNHR